MAFARAYELPTGGLQEELGAYPSNGMGELGVRLFNPFRKGAKGRRGRLALLGTAAVAGAGYYGGKKMGWWGSPSGAVGNGGPAAFGPPLPPTMGPPPSPSSGLIKIPKKAVSGGILQSIIPGVMSALSPAPVQAAPLTPQPSSPMGGMAPILIGGAAFAGLLVVISVLKNKGKKSKPMWA